MNHLRCAVAACALAACTPAITDDRGDEWDVKLGERVVDYHAALRIAALRLAGRLPTLDEIRAVAAGGADAYAAQIRAYASGPAFANQLVTFWRDAFRMGGNPGLDTAPVFAAQLTVEHRPYTELLTATAGTCPTFDAATGTFTAVDCVNGVPVAAGVLTNPAVQALLYSNLAFRRVRWVQETFACTAFPAEQGGTPRADAPTYRSPWPMESIAGADNGGTIDFHDHRAVVCANCHATMNHLAPLFASFDADGVLQPDVAVHTPRDGAPLALRSDWLPAGEPTAWRFGVPAADLPALGAAMAADPAIAECAIARIWNWALGKGDVVDAAAAVPSEVIASQVEAFRAGGLHVDDAIIAIFTSDDFVRF